VSSRLLSDSLVIVLSMADRLFGHISGNPVGTTCINRETLSRARGHGPNQAGIWGGETGQRVVSVIDPDTSTVSGIPTPSNQACLALDRDWNTLYTGNFRDNSVSAIDLTTRTVLATIGMGWNPANIAIDNGPRKLYVANRFSDSISVIEPAH
jgi:YVTN family beta-propeller protein